MDKLIKSKKRVADHGEVFTPPWLVEAMLDLVRLETERIDSRFLEPACGSGNFLVPVLRRKLAAVELKYGKSEFEKRHFALLGLMCIYGIELLADNIAECRANLLEVFAEFLDLEEDDDLFQAASHVLSVNLVHGDAMKMTGHDSEPIHFAEWGYLGKGRFQRRDFRLAALAQASSFSRKSSPAATGSLWSGQEKHEIFTPEQTHPAMTIKELAALRRGEAREEDE
ncbi:MAG: SAM-dependent methyltransferase [Fimbriimonadaceae bacterium]|nr:SAM-dependent methyltransferase [Fimbriimonadaceae bacterium]